MKVKELKHILDNIDQEDELVFYYLKNNDLGTSCDVESIINTELGLEITIQKGDMK